MERIYKCEKCQEDLRFEEIYNAHIMENGKMKLFGAFFCEKCKNVEYKIITGTIEKEENVSEKEFVENGNKM